VAFYLTVNGGRPLIKSSEHESLDRNLGAGVHSVAVRGLIASVVLFMPMMAMAESHLDCGAIAASLNATAHVNFKIVIPKVLYLNVASEDDRAGAPTVVVMSTGRDVTLNATLRAPAAAGPASVHAAAGSSIVLTATARKSIAQNVPCTRGNGPVVCTASMP
jgi:hypothetical protein